MLSNAGATESNANVGIVTNIYTCDDCEYITSKKFNLDKHNATLKHKTKKELIKIAKQMKINEIPNTLPKCYECKCGSQYKNRSGLWRHHKVCLVLNDDALVKNEIIEISNSAKNEIIEISNSVKDRTESNKELTNAILSLIQQNKEIQAQLLELAKEGRNTTINNTTNMTNSFNLNVYLNETCKNAMNMLDYVNSLELDLTDLEETGKLGYTNGMSRIFINGLKDMDVNMRPIHCSDLKREVLYIKDDNVWEKDNENRDKLKGALRKIEKKNIMLIPAYIKAHPNCVISSNRENTPYLKMVMQSTGGENPAETADMAKIITNIAKAVVINK